MFISASVVGFARRRLASIASRWERRWALRHQRMLADLVGVLCAVSRCADVHGYEVEGVQPTFRIGSVFTSARVGVSGQHRHTGLSFGSG